ncbi:MAG: hypothetical protein IH959_01650 [Chloroflexi bacterium]|nr:hypothetical protein [Chloroflexota bacterium]
MIETLAAAICRCYDPGMDWATVVGSLVGVIVGAVIGSLTTWFVQHKLASQQFDYQRRRDESDRAAAFWRDVVLGLRNALGELIALAIREMPARPFSRDDITLDVDKWPKDWKMMHEEQDQLRDTINRFALMSPYRSTVERAKVVVGLIDEYARAEDRLQTLDAVDPQDLVGDEQTKRYADEYQSASETFDETREKLLDAAYALQRHLVALAARPESDPG